MISVTVLPWGYLRAPFGKERLELSLQHGTSVEQMISDLGIEIDIVVTVVINDVTASMGSILEDQDIVKLIPVISGGILKGA